MVSEDFLRNNKDMTFQISHVINDDEEEWCWDCYLDIARKFMSLLVKMTHGSVSDCLLAYTRWLAVSHQACRILFLADPVALVRRPQLSVVT